MKIAVIGSDTVAGQTLAKHSSCVVHQISLPDLSRSAEITVGSPHADRCDPVEICRESDVVVYCGDASRSSWDRMFGDLTNDLEWLPKFVDGAAAAGCLLVYVSSDAVFSGPWVFHAEDSQSFDGSGSAREIRQLESQVLALPNGSVVRSNILGTTADSKSYLDQTVDAILSVQSCRLDATAYASPIAAETFGGILSRIIMQQPRGVLHLSGAERTSPWSFASHLAAVMGSPRNLIQPSAEIQSGTERSLRCSRITSEFGMRLPTMNETLDVVIESLQIPSSLASAA